MLSTLLQRALNNWRRRHATQSADAEGVTDNLGKNNKAFYDTQSALLMLLGSTTPSAKHFDYERVAWVMAAASSAEYMLQHMTDAQNLIHRGPLLGLALEKSKVNGLIMEFGVYRGKSLRAIAHRSAQEVHGFDSFEGLPQDWSFFQKKGRFSLHGQAPHFDEPNIRVHQGYFERTLPLFLAQHPEPARFIHIDCDLYTSTRTVLELLRPRIVSGTVILFDEYLNYPGWQKHEYKAFQEFVAQAGIAYCYLGYASAYYAVAVQVV